MEREVTRVEKATLIYRQKFDTLCGDLTRLTPEARHRWDRWEEKNWQGWSRLRPDPDSNVAKFYRDPQAPGKTTSSAISPSVPALVNQLEYLEALRRTDGPQPAEVAAASDDVRKQLASAAASEAMVRALSGRAEPSPPADAPELRDSP
jgi:hypothetical protein